MAQFNFTITGIGSLPYKNTQTACETVINSFKPGLPFWPQLPKRSFYEGMVTQFSQGIPGIKIDASARKIWLDTNEVGRGLTSFYDNIIKNNLDYFAITPEYAPGLYQIVSPHPLPSRWTSGEALNKSQYLKGQITGPVTFGLTLTDENGQAVIHNETWRDMVVKSLLMKARYQVRMIKQAELLPVIFIDEPSMMQYGSAYLPVNQSVVETTLTEIINALRKEDVLVGIHCCGNTDWGLLLNLPIDIISFDAYGFMDKFILYPSDINKFIKRGGIIAWGLIPSVELSGLPRSERLVNHLQGGITALTKKGLDRTRLVAQSLLTPSCGLGALSEEEVAGRLNLLSVVSSSLRKDKII